MERVAAAQEAKGSPLLISKITEAITSSLHNEAIAFTMFLLCIGPKESEGTYKGAKTHRQKALP